MTESRSATIWIGDDEWAPDKWGGLDGNTDVAMGTCTL